MDFLFGEGGRYEITEDELRNNYSDGYERFRYIALSKLDESGTTLSTDELISKKAIIDEAYQKALDGEDFGNLIAQYSEDYIQIPDDVSDEERNSMDVGDIKVIELSSSFWIIQKCDKNEKDSYFESKKSLIYNNIASPIIDELYDQWENELLITFNDAAVNKYDPRKLEPLFITSK